MALIPQKTGLQLYTHTPTHKSQRSPDRPARATRDPRPREFTSLRARGLRRLQSTDTYRYVQTSCRLLLPPLFACCPDWSVEGAHTRTGRAGRAHRPRTTLRAHGRSPTAAHGRATGAEHTAIGPRTHTTQYKRYGTRRGARHGTNNTARTPYSIPLRKRSTHPPMRFPHRPLHLTLRSFSHALTSVDQRHAHNA